MLTKTTSPPHHGFLWRLFWWLLINNFMLSTWLFKISFVKFMIKYALIKEIDVKYI